MVSPSLSTEPLRDYAGHVSGGQYWFAAPADVDELLSLVRLANSARRPIRIRGNGHSMNGLAVPRPGELVVSLENFRGLRVDSPTSVTIGAGASVWDSCCALERLGIEMLVYNDGNATASTLGGYLSAGGIGHTCHRHGGFWTTVEAVTVVTGAGAVRRIGRGDPEFAWLFGSYGQLGIIVDVTLAVGKLTGHSGDIPVGATCVVETTHHHWERSAWFTVFAPQAQWKVLRGELREIASRHRSAWNERPLYFYPIPFRSFNPPLIHPLQGNLVALGLWGDSRDGGEMDWTAIDGIESDVQSLVEGNRDYRRYLQCERIPAGYDYRAHYGERIWGLFSRLKRLWDPNAVLVSGLPLDDAGSSSPL